MNLKRLLIWLVISVQGLVLLFDISERAKYNNTVVFFLQFENEILQSVANDARYVIAFFLVLPLIAGDFIVIKLFAIVAYCMDLVMVENIYIQVNGEFDKITVEQWMQCGVKLVILFVAFEALIMSILEQPVPKAKPRPISKVAAKPIVQNKQNPKVEQVKAKSA